MWYALIGTIITIAVSLITSLLWKPIDPTQINTKLLSPFLRKYYECKEKSITMQQVSFNYLLNIAFSLGDIMFLYLFFLY